MGSATQEQTVEYIVLPRRLWEKGAHKVVPSLHALREAVSRAWRGPGAAEEIQTQRIKESV